MKKVDPDIRLDTIHVYPLKSMEGEELKSLGLVEFGPKHDPRMMLVDGNSSFINQFQRHKMVFIQAVLDGGPIKLKNQRMTELCIPLEAFGRREVTVEIFGDHCVALES